jgi:RNA polymerase sigma-70 factor (ECF subfamily)
VKAARNHITDTELLEHYHRDKNPDWMGSLLERYTLLLLGLCMKYLKNEEDARDAVQQIFLKVLTEVDKYQIDYFKSWLYMVAKNYCLMRLRSKHGKYTQEINEQYPIAESKEDRTALIENEKIYTLLELSISELSNEQKQCVTLFYLEKKSYQQISQSTGFTQMQVKSFIQNGKRNLRISVEKKLGEVTRK